MNLPSWGRRIVVRTVVAGAVAAVLVAAFGFFAERARFGSDAREARAKVEADVRGQFEALNTELTLAVQEVSRSTALIPDAVSGDTNAIRGLFDALDRASQMAQLHDLAVTVYGPIGRPLAWLGRSTTIPPDRLIGPAALFLVQSSTGYMLVRVEPISALTTPPGGVIVAEVPLPTVPNGGVDATMIDTSVVPVPIRSRVEGTLDSSELIVVPGTNGTPLAAVDLPERSVAVARSAWRTRVTGGLLAVVAVTLLLLIGPLLDWRRLVIRPRVHVAITVTVLALLVTARLVLWMAARQLGMASPPLADPPTSMETPSWMLLASPIDFLLTSFLACGIVAILSSTYEQWRHGRWWTPRVMSGVSGGRKAMFIVTQLLAGAVVGLLLIIYQAFLGQRLSQAPIDIVHFALRPWEPNRIAVAVGLVMLHAGVLAMGVLILRLGIAVWIVPTARRVLRVGLPLLWFSGGVAVALLARPYSEPPPVVPATLAIAFTAAAAFTIGRYRSWLRHASQALRLTALFAALALPSLVFYPSLMEAASRARQQTTETRYAQEVTNQRRDLQLYLAETQQQIDKMSALPDLIEAAEPIAAGMPPADAAFLVWSQTALAEQRLTSSVELYDAKGALVSRFALKLPETSGAQEGTCDWEVVEEVSRFFAEERRLLHADRGICVRGPDGRERKVGSLVVHMMLDYSNLSFISAQSPYAALMRSPNAKPIDAAPDDLEFAVYGWSRRPLYTSERDAWPLQQELFEQLQESREPLWADVRRGEQHYDVYFLNDRFGIYALGYPRISAFDHLVTLAELVTLVGVTFVALLACGALYGRVAVRTPVSGRALLREVRASFYRKLFLAFVLAAVIPVLALAFVTRAYIASLMRADIETEATRTSGSASRVVEDFGSSLQVRAGDVAIDDDLVVWLSRVIAQDVNIFDSSNLLASSERNLFASGLLSTRTPGDVYRAIMLDARSSYLGRESVGGTEYLVAAAPVRFRGRQAILTVPLTLRQQEIQAQIDELDRRVLLATLAFILLGAAIGYSMAERIADPVNRLTRATQRIARGDLDARVVATSSDELRRLVEAFNRMAADLQRQRAELERTNRLAAWADMARQVAHDIKNPLTPIQLNAEHLRRVHIDHGQPLGRIVDECVQNILTQVRLLRSLASEFSSFASSPTPRPTATQVGEVLQEVLEPYRIGLADRVAIETRLGDALPDVYVDRTLLGRALTNIIENALHAMPGGGRLVATAHLDGPGYVVIAIADSGVGMDADSLKRIFEPYFSTKASGTGLGLTIAKRNIELNGGTIAVNSTRGVGTTVELRVPMAA